MHFLIPNFRSYCLAAVLLLVPIILNGQSAKNKFDEKPFIEGDFLVQLNSKFDINSVVLDFPDILRLQNAGLVSLPMNIWLLNFDVIHKHFKFAHFFAIWKRRFDWSRPIPP